MGFSGSGHGNATDAAVLSAAVTPFCTTYQYMKLMTSCFQKQGSKCCSLPDRTVPSDHGIGIHVEACDQISPATKKLEEDYVRRCAQQKTEPRRQGACLQFALIEHVGGKEGQCWVHAVLHSQAVRPHTQHHEPLK